MFARVLSTQANFKQVSFIAGLFVIVMVLEFSTPINYVFGYLYTGPILLVNARFGRVATFKATALAVILTLLNLWIPHQGAIAASTLANRAIATLSLIVTGILSDRHRSAREKMAIEQTKLRSQEQLARLREDFASTLTHDLKTPLLGAIAAIEAFQAEKFGSVTALQQKVLATMARSHQTSLQLVETLLDVYRNDTEGLHLSLAPVDLTALAEEVTSNLANLAATSQVYLSLNYGNSDFRQSLWVNGDKFQLQRVLTNLLVNGIEHSRRGDRVEVVLESQASYQVVKILDRGSGIARQELPYLFERFYQGDSDRQAKGTGLGLYLSRQIIEAHGGTIWAENRFDGGAVFAFRLPVHPH
jgi:two-component system, NarL family, sensor kinase